MTHEELLEIARDYYGHERIYEGRRIKGPGVGVRKPSGTTFEFNPISDLDIGRAQATDLVIHYHISIRYDELTDKWLWLNVSVPRWETNFATWQLAVCAGALARVREMKQ